jgi:hypothetical protein
MDMHTMACSSVEECMRIWTLRCVTRRMVDRYYVSMFLCRVLGVALERKVCD